MLRAWIRGAAALSAALASLAAAPAAAQEAAPAISPLRVESDVNGVNIVDGKIMMPVPVLSVPAAPRLRYDRAPNAAPRLNGFVKNDLSGTASWTVHTGTGTSEQFDCSFDQTPRCSSVTDSGSSLNAGPGGGTYRPTDGAVWQFFAKRVEAFDAIKGGTSYVFSGTAASYPDGELVSYTYEGGGSTFRPIRIDDNLGYYIQLSYAGSDPNYGEWSMVSRAALYATSDPSTPLQQITYTGTTATVIGSDGATRTFACDSCITGTAASTIETTSGTSTLPGESAPALQVNRGALDLVSSVVRDGVTWTYTYTNARTANGGAGYVYDKVTVDGPAGYHVVYDIGVREGRRNVIAAITDSIGRKTSFEYDPSYQPTRIVLPELNEAGVVYDLKGNISQKTTKAKPNSGLTELVETALYPVDTCTDVRCFRPTWYRDAMGRQTDFLWNGYGQVTEQTDPADAWGVRKKTYVEYEVAPNGLSRRKVVRVCGDIGTCGTANEIRTEYDYWGATGLPSVERRIDAARGVTLTTTYGYDSAGRPLVVDGPLAGTDDAVYYRYDGWGRKTWEIGPKNASGGRAAKRFTYRASDDKLVSTESGYVTDPASPTLYVYARSDVTYDARRNPVRESASDGGPVHTLVDKSWDDAGRLVCTAQRMNPAAFGEQPGACAFTSQSGAGPDRITHNVYDNAGQLLQVQKAYGVTTANGFPATLQQNYATYDYTWNGKQKAVTDANGNRAEMTYDGYDHQRRWIFPSATTPGLANASDYEEYGYDAAGNRTSLRKRDATVIVYQYDGANRLRTKIVPASATGAPGYTIWYGYDVRGLTLYARFGTDTGAGVSNAYDGFGRLTSSTSTMGGVSRTVGSDYDAAGNRIRVTHPDGTYFTYDYDAAAAPTLIRENGGTGLLSFQYDGVGRRVVAGNPWWATSYAYDPAWRLQSLEHNLAGTSGDEVLTFGYNAASQVVTRASSNDAYAATEAQNVARGYAVNGLNQYTSVAGSGFSYDLNGNLTSDGSMSLVYDGENRLVAAAGSRSASLAYDPLGRLWQVSGASGTTQFLYDGDARIAEYDGAGNLLSRYVHGADGAADDPLVWYDVAGGSPRRALFADQQGSIVAVADQYGTPLKINAYDEWGVPNAGNLGRFGYTGQTWIPELQMWYYKARFYSAKLGRFLQTDPVGYKDQVNLYAYVGNDPVDGRDPTGLAELNLVRPENSAYRYGDVDFPHAFTILAHSYTEDGLHHLVEDQRGSGNAKRLSPHELFIAAQQKGFHKGDLTVLLSCSVGAPMGRASFAQAYAIQTGGRVVASPGGVTLGRQGSIITATARDSFYAYDPDGKTATYLGNKMIYNAETGKGFISRDPEIGSRLGSRIRVCLKAKCDD